MDKALAVTASMEEAKASHSHVVYARPMSILMSQKRKAR